MLGLPVYNQHPRQSIQGLEVSCSQVIVNIPDVNFGEVGKTGVVEWIGCKGDHFMTSETQFLVDSSVDEVVAV